MNRVLHAGLAAVGCLLAAAILVVAVPLPHAAEPATISYHSDLATLIRLAPYPAVAPAGLPGSWQPVSSGLAVGGANGAGTVTWLLGYTTPDGTLALLGESNASAHGFIDRMSSAGLSLPPVRLAGLTWHRAVNIERSLRSMYYTSVSGRTIAVTGNASWAELRQLAVSLHPVAG